MSRSCEACGEPVSVAGGIANIWTHEADETGGITLELTDGTEQFLCFDCLDRLPDDPTAADVDALDGGVDDGDDEQSENGRRESDR